MPNPHQRPKKKPVPAQTGANQSQPTLGLPRAQRKRSFRDFKSLVTYAKGMVYAIVRIRDINGQTFWRNLGTGFLSGDHRLTTCYHCVADPQSKEPMDNHQDGDLYLFVQKDEFGAFHHVGVVANENQNLFLHPNIDTAVFYLEDDFYQVNGKYLKHPEMYLEFATRQASLGAEIGIIGYPFANLKFDSQGGLDIDEVYIRADKGVVNTAYEIKGVRMYEFTTAFNPGNSGGPIFDVASGAVIGMVHGYRPMPTHWVDDLIPAGKLGNATDTPHCYQLRTIYSLGISSLTVLNDAGRHSLGKN